jgi:circadian clock protein KaiC
MTVSEGSMTERAKTGIAGLDDILQGGLPRERFYLVEGTPGVGKTTLGLQFLLAGRDAGERSLYVTLSETESEIRAVAASHGWSLTGIDVLELRPENLNLDEDEDNTVFQSSEIELRETVRKLVSEVSRHRPARVVLDSLSEVRLQAQSQLQFRRTILRLRQHFVEGKATVLMLDDGAGSGSDEQLQSIAHGVIALEQLPQGYGSERRRLRVVKLRGLKFRGGYHDYRLDTGGIVVFPRLVAAEHRAAPDGGSISTGNRELDALLGGGLDRGTCTLVLGPSGTGKSSLTLQFATACASRGEHVCAFLFDEGIGTVLTRARALGMPIDRALEQGHLQLKQVDPAELAPDELIHHIRHTAQSHPPGVVILDSINGYMHAMPNEHFLLVQLHELVTYLAQHGVVTLLVMSQHGLLGQNMTTPVDVSYVADTVVLTRFFEAGGRVRKAISVMKKRSGAHEQAIRELRLGPDGLELGRPLEDFRGVLTGVPVFAGEPSDLLGREK